MKWDKKREETPTHPHTRHITWVLRGKCDTKCVVQVCRWAGDTYAYQLGPTEAELGDQLHDTRPAVILTDTEARRDAPSQGSPIRAPSIALSHRSNEVIGVNNGPQ